MKKILFVSPHTTGRVPCQRFRYEQYTGYLKEKGFETTFSPILDPEDYLRFYDAGNYRFKLGVACRGVLRRLRDVLRASWYDIIFIQREAIQLGPAFFETLFSYSRAKLVFDFDDAIWVSDVSSGNQPLAWLKRPEKTANIIRACDVIFAGNRYLRDYALQYNNNVHIVPTTIETNEYVPEKVPRTDDRVCIGWSGSMTTIKHFELAIPFLRRLKKKYGDKIHFRVIGSTLFQNEELGIKGQGWFPKTEVADLCQFDIGIMPLPDSDWAKGKCGLKGLQFMALEIPTVMSGVGVNSEIISNGVNGLVVHNEEEWVSQLSKLIESRELREKLGKAGRQTVIDDYSVESQQDNYLTLLQSTLAETKKRTGLIGLGQEPERNSL